MILRHHVPGIGNHVVDQFVEADLLLPLTDVFQDRLKPEQLIALRFIVKEVGQTRYIQLL